ncbi:hypothetical protein NQ317_012418 [Molorchus minor]|uniref:Tyr recombinase domain-containing protein n=1 Tax=Molorchus minor TaxID=1323400 RepID=A0ABQ9JET0_9CUCU|nr:hypothetical protein NQ317_012418 [Molorchus minor]
MEEKYAPVESVDVDADDGNISSIKLLPERSKAIYEGVYQTFMNWREAKEEHTFSENVLMAYFEELSTIEINNSVSIDKYGKLRAFLRRTAENYKAKKSKIFTADEVKKFINEAPNNVYLATKVALIIGIMGSCRVRELHSLTIEDVKDFGSALLVTIPHCTYNTKTYRKFTITDQPYTICRQYINLRPANAPPSFFLNYQKGKCTIQNIGINKFGSMGRQIAKFLKLPDPEMYTGAQFTTIILYTVINTVVVATALKLLILQIFIVLLANSVTNQLYSDSEIEEKYLPTEIVDDDNISPIKLLPERSKAIYESAYHTFMNWREAKEEHAFSENVLMAYFEELAEKYKSSSLWTHYSMLKSTLEINHGVALIIGIMGSCRMRELHSLNIEDVKDLGSALLITMPDMKTKLYRKFTITDEPYTICRQYIDLRPANAPCSFFLNFQKGKCTVQKIGKNKFGVMGRQIARFLKLPDPEMYTGRSFRKSATTLM